MTTKDTPASERPAGAAEWKYDAFISYRHQKPAKPVAERLQKLLETYVPPKELRADKPVKLRLFRDETELPTSNDLGGDIKTALEQSRFLVVICSPDYEESKWCMQEIDYFRALHNGSNRQILTLLVGDPDEPPRFPEPLRFEPAEETLPDGTVRRTLEEIEPLAANVSAKTQQQALKKLKTEFLRIAAPLLGCGFDDLYQREQRRRAQRKLRIALSAAGAMAAATALSAMALVTISSQKTQIAADARELRQSNIELLLRESDTLHTNGDLYGALRSAVDAYREKTEDVDAPNGAVERIASITGAFEPKTFTAFGTIGLKSDVQDLCLFSGGTRLAVSEEEMLSLWNTKTGERIQTFTLPQSRSKIYRDHEIDRCTSTYVTKGSVTATPTGESYYFQMYEKDLREETQRTGNALYVCPPEEGCVQRISPEDGSVLWSTALEDPSFLSCELLGADGLPVHSGDELVLLAPADGKVLARISNERLDEAVGEHLFYDAACYEQGHLILLVFENDAAQLHVFRQEEDSLRYLYQKDLPFQSMLGDASLTVRGQTICAGGIIYDEMISSTCFFYGFDLETGAEKWALSDTTTQVDDPIMGWIEEDKGAENGFPLAFTIIGNRLFAVNADSGETVLTSPLPGEAKDGYYSENGFVFVTNEDGVEYYFALRRMQRTEPPELSLHMNHDYQTEVLHAAYCNNVYAVVKQNEHSVKLYRPILNAEMDTVYRYDSEDDALYGTVLSPDGTLAATRQYPEKDVLILDLQTKRVVKTIPLKGDDYNQFWFLGAEYLAVERADAYEIYALASGKLADTLREEDYEFYHAEVSPQAGEILAKDREDDATLWSIRPGAKPERILDPEKLAACGGERLEIEGFQASPSGEKVFFILSDYFEEAYRYRGYFYDRETQTVTCLIEELEPYTTKADGCAWAEDGSVLYLMFGRTIYGFDCATGAERFCFELTDFTPEAILAIGSDLCVMDGSGTLVKMVPEDGTLKAEHSLPLQIPGASNLLLSAERCGDGRLYLRYYDTAWLLDEERFEIVYRIPKFCGASAVTNRIYTEFYADLNSYPAYTPDEIAARGESFLQYSVS